MRKTITITDPMQVKTGDKAYFKDCDFGFTVIGVNKYDGLSTFKVNIPMSEAGFWADSSLFDHATREFGEPEWPDPHGVKLHVYLGADGVRYIYNPFNEDDTTPWIAEGCYMFFSRETMGIYHRDALPLTELRLIPAKDDDDEQ